MKSTGALALAAAALLLSVPLASCSVRTESGSGPDESVFLDALSGPIRDKYPDSVLIAEGKKACDAFAQGQSEDQVEAMIKTDLGVNPGQFIGAVYGGLHCFSSSHPNRGGN